MTKSPTARLLVGLLVTLGAVTGFSWYALYQLHGLRKLQTDILDLNRHDSLLLFRIQNDVNTIGLKLRDMTQPLAASAFGAYRTQFAVLREDLEQAIQADAKLNPVTRPRLKQAEFEQHLAQFWRTSDEVFRRAAAGDEHGAQTLVSSELSSQQSLLSTQLSHLLQRNTETEERADERVATIYDEAQWNIYAFLAATMLAIAATTLYLIYSNRRIFGKIESLSRQRRVLAARLITVQEEVLRSVSRELHDEFGQILTAVGTMLARAERKGVPADSPLRSELSEIREITHGTIEKMRSLSQMLHPAILDDYGLAKGIEWYTQTFQRQTGIETSTIYRGNPVRITGQPAIHCFRIVQEALNNAAKHSHTKRAEVELIFSPEELTVNVRDFGRGIERARNRKKPGLGLIAMHERAELLSGKLTISSIPEVGATVSLTMPQRQEDTVSEALETENMEEVVAKET